jgi:pSer/pThr/pTyr-binding forkhead associated (FHA) protein
MFPGREFTLVDHITIGRDVASEFPLMRDTHVSASHARILRDGDAVMVLDLQSTNGTKVNGTPVENRMKLQTGDVLSIGLSELRVTINIHQ